MIGIFTPQAVGEELDELTATLGQLGINLKKKEMLRDARSLLR